MIVCHFYLYSYWRSDTSPSLVLTLRDLKTHSTRQHDLFYQKQYLTPIVPKLASLSKLKPKGAFTFSPHTSRQLNNLTVALNSDMGWACSCSLSLFLSSCCQIDWELQGSGSKLACQFPLQEQSPGRKIAQPSCYWWDQLNTNDANDLRPLSTPQADDKPLIF